VGTHALATASNRAYWVIIIYLFIYLFYAQGISDTEGEEKIG